jgi:hypothetical protein
MDLSSATPGTDGVRKRDAAGPIGIQQTRHAEHGVLAEVLRIEEVVIHPTIDHIHPARPLGRAHEDLVFPDEQILPFNQLDTHLLGQEGVLEVGGVVGTRGQHDDGRIRHANRRKAAQGMQQHVRIMLDGRNPVAGEQFGEQAHHHAAVFKHVRDTRRHPQVVLQHVELPCPGPHHVHTGNGRIDVTGHIDALHLGRYWALLSTCSAGI